MGKIAWEKWAAMLICIAFAVLAAILGLRYLFPVLVPFLLAWLLSLAIRPAAHRLSSRTGIPRKLWAAILLLLVIGILLATLYMTAQRLITELEELLDAVLDQTPDSAEQNSDFFSMLAAKLPLLQRFSDHREVINRTLSDMASNLLITLSSALPTLLASFFSSVPSVLFAVLVTVIAAFYFCMADRDLPASLSVYLPASVQKKLPGWKRAAKGFARRFLRAYLLLLALTFALLLTGFLILGQKYAFLLALVVALVDLLPVLGVGTVLVPWAVVAFWRKQYFMGLGLLILYVTVLVVREIAEPKLLGKTFGIHPLPALMATFAGWYLFGFWGMLLSPIVAVLLKTLFEMTIKKEVHNEFTL